MSYYDIATVLVKGLEVTLSVIVCSTVAAFILSFMAGLARLSKYAVVRFIAAVYVEVFRGTSLLVQLFWLYFVLPFFGIKLPAFFTAVFAIGLNYGAYGSEIVRSSILSVDNGQHEASIALNISPFKELVKITIPQAFVRMMPAFGNLQIELIKATSLVSLITLADLTYEATILNSATMQTTEIYTSLLVIYFLLSLPFVWTMRFVEKKISGWR